MHVGGVEFYGDFVCFFIIATLTQMTAVKVNTREKRARIAVGYLSAFSLCYKNSVCFLFFYHISSI